MTPTCCVMLLLVAQLGLTVSLGGMMMGNHEEDLGGCCFVMFVVLFVNFIFGRDVWLRLIRAIVVSTTIGSVQYNVTG